MNRKRYIGAACEFNQAARRLGLDELPLDLPAYFVRDKALLLALVDQVEAALRPLQRLLDDLQTALWAEQRVDNGH